HLPRRDGDDLELELGPGNLDRLLRRRALSGARGLRRAGGHEKPGERGEPHTYGYASAEMDEGPRSARRRPRNSTIKFDRIRMRRADFRTETMFIEEDLDSDSSLRYTASMGKVLISDILALSVAERIRLT